MITLDGHLTEERSIVGCDGVLRYQDGPHKFSSTQFNLEGEVVDKIKAMQAKIANDDLAEDGKETDIHVTLKYGIHTTDSEEVKKIIKGFGKVKITLGKTSIFPAKEATTQRGGDEHDVIKIDVESDDLMRLNKIICDKLECTDTHPIYKPHVTLAYVKAGEGKKYVGDETVDGMKVTFGTLVFSPSEGDKTSIKCYSDSPIDSHGHLSKDVSNLIVQRATQEMANEDKKKSTKRWANEIKRRIALKNMLIDYDEDTHYMVDASGRFYGEFRESEHPRAQGGEHGGEFVDKGGKLIAGKDQVEPSTEKGKKQAGFDLIPGVKSVKKAKDFETTGNRLVTLDNGEEHPVFFDRQSGCYYHGNHPGYGGQGLLGTSKADVLPRLVKDFGQYKPNKKSEKPASPIIPEGKLAQSEQPIVPAPKSSITSEGKLAPVQPESMVAAPPAEKVDNKPTEVTPEAIEKPPEARNEGRELANKLSRPVEGDISQEFANEVIGVANAISKKGVLNEFASAIGLYVDSSSSMANMKMQLTNAMKRLARSTAQTLFEDDSQRHFYEERMSAIMTGMGEMMKAVLSRPQPPITVNVAPPSITINPPNIRVDAPITVNTPEIIVAPPEITVNTPDVKIESPVTVNIPPALEPQRMVKVKETTVDRNSVGDILSSRTTETEVPEKR